MIMLKSKMYTIQFLHCMLIILIILYQTALGADEVCGQSSYKVSEDSMRLQDSSMLGKTIAAEGAWPWMAAIRMRRGSSGNYDPWCSGFLIDKRHVLSAAHCYHVGKIDLYRVRIGRNNQNEGDEYRITGIAVPPGYKTGLYYDNVAVLTLDRDVNSPNYNPICLPNEKVRKIFLVGQNATVAGWGSDEPMGAIGANLKQVNGMQIVRNQDCQRSFRQAIGDKIYRRQFPHGMNKSFLCAGSIEGKKGVCGGDSGAPLMIKYRNRWFAVGIVSFGYSCGAAGIPEGYTNVSTYLEWIKKNSSG